MIGYISILRPLNCLMAGFAVLIGAKLGSPIFLSSPVLLAIIVAILICGAGNSINDYFDFEIDRINNPNRPIPSGRITPSSAYQFSVMLFSLGVFLSIFINPPALMIALINSLLLFYYAKSIKRKGGLLKNLTVSYLVASPFLFGGIAVGNPRITLFLVFIAFLVNTAREVVKDIEDYEGDKDHLESISVRFGFQIAGQIASVFIIATIALSPIPYKMGMVNNVYILFIAAADLLLFYSLIELIRRPKERSPKVKKMIKIAMVLALLGFFIGSI